MSDFNINTDPPAPAVPSVPPHNEQGDAAAPPPEPPPPHNEQGDVGGLSAALATGMWNNRAGDDRALGAPAADAGAAVSNVARALALASSRRAVRALANGSRADGLRLLG